MPIKSFKVPVEPVVMKWARESAGRTIEDVATRLRVSEALIKKWESGGDRPTVNRLKTLSEYYQRPLDAFLLETPPDEPAIPRDFRFRSLPKQDAVPYHSDTFFALRKARRLQSVAEDLNGVFCDKLTYRFGEITENSDPEIFASKLRSLMGIDAETQLKWKNEYEALNGWIKALNTFDIIVVQMSMPLEDTRAFCLINGGYPVIVLNTKESPSARIFSLFHELGHIILNIEGICDPSGYPISGSGLRDIEIFCNHFAGAVLVPEHSLIDHHLVKKNEGTEWSDRTLRAISRGFKVSKEVILRRLLKFNLTTNKFYRKWKLQDEKNLLEKQKRKEESSGGGGRDIARECIQQNSEPIVSLVLKSYYTRRITEYDISDYLEINLKHLPSIERALEV